MYLKQNQRRNFVPKSFVWLCLSVSLWITVHSNWQVVMLLGVVTSYMYVHVIQDLYDFYSLS